MPVKNPNVKSVETVLVVETDLELNAADPAFDVAKVDALIDAAMKSFAASGGTVPRRALLTCADLAHSALRVARRCAGLQGCVRLVNQMTERSARIGGHDKHCSLKHRADGDRR